MKITLLTAGSRGDVQPFIALAIELKKLDQDVTIVAGKNFQSLIEQYGINYARINMDVSEIIASGIANQAIKADNPLKVIRSLGRKDLLKKLESIQQDYYDACQDCDVIVYHPGTAAIASGIAEMNGIKSVLASPFPLVKTKEYPALIFYNLKFPSLFNAFTHTLFLYGFWLATRKPTKLFFKNTLNKHFRLKNPLVSKDLKLIACSNHIFKTEKDGYAAGFWFLDEPDSYQPDTDLKDFLEKGDKPIYIGFGSIANKENTAAMTKIIINASLKANVRVILATGYGGLSNEENLPVTVKIIQGAPHSWLFPKMAAVMHHGGAGTTAAALRAGVPMIVVPHGNDQFAWAKRTYELGVAAKPIKLKDFTVQSVLTAFEEVKSQQMKDKAIEMGEKIQHEKGAYLAAKKLLEVISL